MKNTTELPQHSDASANHRERTRRTYGAGLVAGLVAGSGMGLLLQGGTNLLPFIGALYGHPTVIGGWVAHLVNSVVFSFLFVAIVSRPIVRAETKTLSDCLCLGIGYSAVLGIVTSGVLLPLWLTAAGVTTPPIPLSIRAFESTVLLGLSHLVYGMLLGASYAFLNGVGSRPRQGRIDSRTDI